MPEFIGVIGICFIDASFSIMRFFDCSCQFFEGGKPSLKTMFESPDM